MPEPAETPRAARQVALVTGASSGIGAELARVLARHGHDLALVGRRAERLEALADDIATGGRPRPIVIALDLSSPGACAQLGQALARENATPAILVNNAGFGLVGEARTLDSAEQLQMIDLNVRILSELTFGCLPALVAARGRILNVASVAGFLPGPGMAVYYATKAFVVSFSEALYAELAASGVTVSVLCPGVTRTGFQARAGFAEASLDAIPGMSARAVAEAGYAGMMAGRRRIVPGLSNKMMLAILNLVPNAWLLPVVARLQARRRGA